MAWRSLLTKAEEAITQERYDDARGMLVRVLQRHPDEPEAWLLLSRTMGDDAARRLYCLERAIEVDPTNPAVPQELARLGWRGEHVADIGDMQMSDLVAAV